MQIIFTIEFHHIWLTFIISRSMKTNLRISQFSGFLLRPGPYAILVKIWKWLKFLNSLPFIKGNMCKIIFTIEFDHISLPFTTLWQMKRNLKISNIFSISAKVRAYAILVKIWKWLKLLNSVPFMQKTFANHVYIWIWSFGLTLTVLKWMKTNVKISQSSRFLLRPRNTILFKISKRTKIS